MTSITDSIRRLENENDDLRLRVAHLVSEVSFPGYQFVVRESHGGVHLQAHYDEPDIHTKKMERQYTRKWLLSPKMSDSEIVATAFKMCLTSCEHRAREAFTYKGARIFGPHFDVEDLVKVCLDGKGENGGR